MEWVGFTLRGPAAAGAIRRPHRDALLLAGGGSGVRRGQPWGQQSGVFTLSGLLAPFDVPRKHNAPHTGGRNRAWGGEDWKDIVTLLVGFYTACRSVGLCGSIRAPCAPLY
eukprot:311389-Chlamydomonas_euryale.AAC.3